MNPDLFDHASAEARLKSAPLAARMRPGALDEFAGQEHLLGPGRPLWTALERDRLWSALLWGPPGSGKTTLATLAAATTKSHFIALSAVTAGVADIKAAAKSAKDEFSLHRRGTLLFVDEVHRFNKSQQDALLPYVEDGTVVFWGATTENPYFEVIAPLLSRVRVLKLNPLSQELLEQILDRALSDVDRGLGEFGLGVTEDARRFIIDRSGGDARIALNWLEAAAELAMGDGVETIELGTVERSVLVRQVRYDRKADEHYDTISAFIKSVRGSDPDASVLWLAKMLHAGEQPEFIARRLLILASEDVGNADPQAISVALAAYQAVERLGLPEATYALAQATIYLATAPKSNSAGAALQTARAAIDAGADLTVPLHLRNEAFAGAKALGYGRDYKYAHDYPDHFVEQDYRPESLKGVRLYEPSSSGYESQIAERLERLRSASRVDSRPDYGPARK